LKANKAAAMIASALGPSVGTFEVPQ
jgi:hypothetical protein